METGKLFIVATPIGNYQDITLRALEVLKNVDAVICEEYRQGSTLLKKLELPQKELITLNEHNENEQTAEIINRLAQNQSFALVSDCGTPVFADPGHYLISQVSQFNFDVVPIPGPSSLMAALSILDFKMEQFVYGGFLPRVPAERRNQLQKLRSVGIPVVLMDTPYRLDALLEDIIKIFGANQSITLAYNLTLNDEKIFRDSAAELRKKLQSRKGEYVLIIHSPKSNR
ncbi:MAG: 16S rRNA (cytidine(1402)-2'-O)-methyltransferase [Anaerolineaceae bacterium]